MSHITTEATKIQINNESWIKKAIALMGKEFPGLTYEQKTPDMILVRYAPIEVYQTKGNLRFIKNPDKTWSMQLDTWNCDAIVKKVKNSFVTNYQTAGIMAFNQKYGYTQSTKTTEKGNLVIAQKW